MKSLVRLFIVLNLAAVLVVLVQVLVRHLGPQTGEQWRQWASSRNSQTQASPEALRDDSEPSTDPKLDPLPAGDAGTSTWSASSAPPSSGHDVPAAGSRGLPKPSDKLVEAPVAPSIAANPQSNSVPAATEPPRLAEPDASPSTALADRLHSSKADTPEDPADELRNMDAFDLMRQAQGADGQAADRAAAELRRRGCTQVELELARRLFDHNAQVRKALAQALPRLQSVDAAPWLLQLSRDDDADVRMAAITVMCTTGDSRLLEQVELIARQDPDERVRELAERIGQQRDAAGYRAARVPGAGMR